MAGLARGQCSKVPGGSDRDERRARRMPLVLAVAVALDRRPYCPGKRNYVPIMIIALAASLVLGRHLLTLVAYN